MSQALDVPYEALLDNLAEQGRLNVDETGHRDCGERWWTWCFRASLYTVFKIDPTRSGDVLLEVLGKEFDGVLGCDYFSAYRRYMRECNVLVQFCLAHLIRDVKYLTTLPDARDRAYGARFARPCGIYLASCIGVLSYPTGPLTCVCNKRGMRSCGKHFRRYRPHQRAKICGNALSSTGKPISSL